MTNMAKQFCTALPSTDQTLNAKPVTLRTLSKNVQGVPVVSVLSLFGISH